MTDSINAIVLSDREDKPDFPGYMPDDFVVQYSTSIEELNFSKNQIVFIDARMITRGDISIALNEKKGQSYKSLFILFFTEKVIQEGYSKFDSCIDDVILLSNPSEIKLKLHYIKSRFNQLTSSTDQNPNKSNTHINPLRYNELEQSEELHRVILSNISDAVFVTDEVGDFTFVCPNVNVIFGYEREEVLERKNISSLLGKYIHKQDFNDGVSEKSNIEIVTPDKQGKLHHLLVNIKKVDIRNGKYLFSCRDITYRKSIEAKLQESETTCQQLFDISPAAMRLMDKSRNIVMSNKLYDEYNKKFGFKTIDKCCNSFNAGVCFSEKCSLNAVVKTKKPVSGFFEYQTPQNESVNFLLDAIPFRNHKNEITGVLESFRDVTELKKAQNAITERELQFNQLAENIKEVFWIFDWEEQHVKYVSPAFEEVWGIKPEELYNDYSLWGKSIYPDDATYAYKSFQQIAQGKLTDPRQYRITKPDGSIRWIEDKGFPVFDKSNNLTKIVGIAEDITERKHTEIELRKLAVVTEQNPIGIVITNTKGIIEYVNSSFALSRGYKKEELIGGTPSKFSSGYHPPTYFNKLWESIRKGKVWQGNIMNKARTGKMFWEKVVISPVISKNGNITHYVGMQEDITEQIRTQKALKVSEQEFRQLFNYIPDPILIVNTENHKIIKANNAALKQYGYTKKELTKLSLLDIDASQLITYGEKNLQNSLSKKIIVETQHKTKKEEQFPVEVHSGFITLEKKTYLLSVCRNITERKKIEDELKKSEKQYRTLVENQGEGVGITDENEVFLFANPAAHKIFGVDEGSLIGRSLKEFIQDDSIPFIIEETEKRKKGLKSTYEIEIYRPNGKKVHLLTTVTPQYNEDGGFFGTFGVFRDITDRIAAQLELRQSEERYRLLHEVAGVGIGYFKPNGDIISLNKLATKYIGGNPRDFIGKNIIDVYSEAEAAKHFRRFESVIKFGVMFEYEDHVQTQDGQKWFLSTYNVVESEDKKLLGIQVLSKDISEQMKARLQVEKYMQRLTSIINTVGDGITLANSEGDFEIYNPKMQEITGYNKVEVYKKSTFYDVLYPDAQERNSVFNEIENLKIHKKNITYETNIVAKDGNLKTLLVTSSIFIDEGDEYFLSSYTDITDRKKYIEEIKLYQNHLEELVDQGIAKLQQSEQKYSELFRAMRSGFIRKSVEGEIIECNDAFQQMINYPKEELYKLKDTDITPSKWQKHEELIFDEQVLKKGYSDLYEKEYSRKDGSIFPAEVQTYLSIENGDIAGTWSIVNDITERKEMERKIVRTITDTEEKERKRFSSDLHDSLGALLSGIKMYLNLLHSGKLKDSETDRIFTKAKQLVSSAVNNTREISANIMPPEISRYGLVKSLQSFFERINETGKIFISFNHKNYKPLLKKEEELILYRVVNELLNNSMKHSNAEHVDVNIFTYQDTIGIIYSDDGIGFDFVAITKEQKGIGLQNITNRIESINGKISFDTSPGNGVIVVISIKNQ